MFDCDHNIDILMARFCANVSSFLFSFKCKVKSCFVFPATIHTLHEQVNKESYAKFYMILKIYSSMLLHRITDGKTNNEIL